MMFGDDPRGFAFIADPAAWIGHDVLLVGRSHAFSRGLKSVHPYFTYIDHQVPVAVTVSNEILFEAQIAIG